MKHTHHTHTHTHTMFSTKTDIESKQAKNKENNTTNNIHRWMDGWMDGKGEDNFFFFAFNFWLVGWSPELNERAKMNEKRNSLNVSDVCCCCCWCLSFILAKYFLYFFFIVFCWSEYRWMDGWMVILPPTLTQFL